MKKYLLIILSFFIFLFNTCSTKYMYPELSDFSDATDLIGKNIIYIFEKFQEEEMNLRVAQLVEKNSIKPEDLEPKVLTFQHLETRKSLINYLVKYTRLLVTVFKKDYRKEIIENSKDVKSSLEEISENHKNFLSKKEIGIISTIAAAIPEALTYSKKRKVVKKIMRQNQILLEKIIGKLEGEMNSLQKVIQNFYDRQFILMVKKKWPEKESQREKYAKIGLKIILKRNKMNIILSDVIKGISCIPRSHQELITLFEKNKTPLTGLKELINYSYRMKELYMDYSK